MTISGEWIGLLAACAAFTGALAAPLAWLGRRSRAATRRDLQRLFEQVDLCIGELHGLSAAQASMLGTLTELRGQLDGGRRAAVPAATPLAARSYDIALRLARNGASREELMSNCGMSRHEAELAVRLHGPASRGSAARAAAAG